MKELKRFAIILASLTVFGTLFCGCMSSDEGVIVWEEQER